MQIVSLPVTFEITTLMKSEELEVFPHLEIWTLGIKDDKAEGPPTNKAVGRVTFSSLL